MANFIQKGDVIDFTNTTEIDIAYGQVVVLGNHVCVAAECIKAGEAGGLRTNGVFEFDADKNVEIKIGDQVYYDTANDCITNNKGTLTTVPGIALTAKPSATEGTVQIKIFN